MACHRNYVQALPAVRVISLSYMRLHRLLDPSAFRPRLAWLERHFDGRSEGAACK